MWKILFLENDYNELSVYKVNPYDEWYRDSRLLQKVLGSNPDSTVLQTELLIRRGIDKISRIIFLISQLKHML